MIRVFNIERFAIKDGPGIRTVVFLDGCPLHCPWCSNPESRSIEGGKLRGADDILDEVMRDSDYYRETGGGLTLSGGEALCQGDKVTSLLRKARERGLHTAVETTGNVPERLFDAALPYVDLWLFEIDVDVLSVSFRMPGVFLDAEEPGFTFKSADMGGNGLPDGLGEVREAERVASEVPEAALELGARRV